MSRPPHADFYRPDNCITSDSVGHLVKCVAASLACASDRRLDGFDLTGPQCALLLRLQHTGKVTVSELARALVTDPGAVTRMVDRLERKKLLARTRAHTDRRVVQVELTAEGEALVPQASDLMAQTLNAHLVGFSRADLHALASQLKHMLANGEAMRRLNEKGTQP